MANLRPQNPEHVAAEAAAYTIYEGRCRDGGGGGGGNDDYDIDFSAFDDWAAEFEAATMTAALVDV
jgi:hypothetical protein